MTRQNPKGPNLIECKEWKCSKLAWYMKLILLTRVVWDAYLWLPGAEIRISIRPDERTKKYLSPDYIYNKLSVGNLTARKSLVTVLFYQLSVFFSHNKSTSSILAMFFQTNEHVLRPLVDE